MQRLKRQRKRAIYPQETEGSRLASKVRKMANKLTEEEEAEYLRQGLAKIYAERPQEISGARH